jgi:preprotein translocase subunit SecB
MKIRITRMTKNYKILTSYVKDISSKISGTENYIYLKDNIPKYSLGIDINSLPLKNNMAEVNIRLTFDNKNEKDKKAYFEMTHTTVVRVEESAVNKNELKKIFLSDVPTEVYPEIEKKFFEIVKSIGYPEIKLEKKINFQELFEKNQK